MRNKNSYTIFAWMHEELGLRNLEEKVYAFLYDFSQKEGKEYSGSLRNVAQVIGCSEAGVIKTLKSLTEKELLIKREIPIPGTGLRRCGYRINEECFEEV